MGLRESRNLKMCMNLSSFLGLKNPVWNLLKFLSSRAHTSLSYKNVYLPCLYRRVYILNQNVYCEYVDERYPIAILCMKILLHYTL